ncbi:MAG: pitrilysin family protein [Roseivirga sp.]
MQKIAANIFIFALLPLIMINFESFELSNGLRVIVHEDHNTPMAVLNILYDVGSRDEHEDKTGFAHLFEHLMFGGSKHIPSYDEPLQRVGGDNNAFTSPDITNYYITVPAVNLETAFWLESDRMLSLSFDPKVLEVQRSVVIEEFKQRYLNQPYGDVMLKLRPLAYQKHPYRWPTIGKEISHIEEATMGDVKSFFAKHYLPNNAIMVVAGNVTVKEVEALAKKWFGNIPAGIRPKRALPAEPTQMTKRVLEAEGKVPSNGLYMAFHMPARMDDAYYAADLLSDMLGRGKSSRLYNELVEGKKLFHSLNAYVSGSIDPGLLMVEGKTSDGVTLGEAEAAVWQVLQDFKSTGFSEEELAKVKNKAESTLVFSEVELLNRAMNLAFAANMGNADLVNQEVDQLQSVTPDQVIGQADTILKESNASVLRYTAI